MLAVDRDEKIIEDFAGKCTSAVCADLSNEDEILSLGLKNMDIVVIAMGDDLAASILTLNLAKEQGVPLVVEMLPEKEWIGKCLSELNLRSKKNLNVVAIRKKGGKWHFVDPSVPIEADSILLIVMEKKHLWG